MTLEEYSVPKINDKLRNNAIDNWRKAHLHKGKVVEGVPETLISNWLQIKFLPEHIRIFDFKAGIVIGKKDQALRESFVPLVPYRRGFIGLCSIEEYQDAFGENLPLKLVGELEVSEFMRSGWESQGIEWFNGNQIMVDLLRQALQRYLNNKGLNSIVMANGQVAWWWQKQKQHEGMIRFSWDDTLNGRRQIVGDLEKGKIHWHYGLSFTIHFLPMPHITLTSRVIFSQDGVNPIGNSDYMFQLRRSKTKSWRNPRWRDMMLVFLWHLEDGSNELCVEIGSEASMIAEIPPLMFEAPITVLETELTEEDAAESEGSDLDCSEDIFMEEDEL
jgi:hypothetical protein